MRAQRFKKETSIGRYTVLGENSMSPRKKTILYLNPEIVKEARDLRLHVSMIANDCLAEAVLKMKEAPDEFPDRWKLKPDYDKETELVCYYCGSSLGVAGRGGTKLIKCPVCGRAQQLSGITVIEKETKEYLRRLEKRLKGKQRSK